MKRNYWMPVNTVGRLKIRDPHGSIIYEKESGQRHSRGLTICQGFRWTLKAFDGIQRYFKMPLLRNRLLLKGQRHMLHCLKIYLSL